MRRRARRQHRGWLRWLTDVCEDALIHRTVRHERDDAHRLDALRASQRVACVDARQQKRQAAGDRTAEIGLGCGDHREIWDGLDAAGRPMPSGLYVARLRAGGVTEAIKLTLVR